MKAAAASSRCAAPSACFFVQPAPATKRSGESGLIVDSPPLPAATTPLIAVRVSAAPAPYGMGSGATPSWAQMSPKSDGSVRITHGRAARENAVRMRWR